MISIPTISKCYLLKFKTPHSLEILSPNSDSKAVCDQIHLLLPLNQLQHLIVEGILDHSIKYKDKMFFDLDQQLLVYIRGEGGIGKSRVVNAIQIDYFLYSKRREFVISASTNSAANSIGKSIVYTTLKVNNRAGKNY